MTFVDGDVYTLTVTGPDGETVYTNSVTVTQYDTESVCSFACQEMTVTI